MILRVTLFLAWGAAAALFLRWAASRPFFVGRMVLPRAQAVAVALIVLLLLTLAALWIWMALWPMLRYMAGTAARSWVEHPAARYPLLAALVLFGLGLVYGRTVEPRWVALRRLHLGQGSPTDPEAVRIAVISDLHIDGPRRPFVGLDRLVNETDPDLVLFLGDSLNRARALPVLHRLLAGIRARHAKLAVSGNWEAWYWGRLPLLRGTGFEWLDHATRTFHIRGVRLHVAGLAYHDQDQARAARRLTERPAPGGWRIFLYHTPDLATEVPSADIYLCGHTHGGQIHLPLFGALVTLSRHGKRFERGLSRAGRTLVYVNPGIGVEPMVPLRLGVRPEITLITLGPRAGPPGEP